MQKLLRRTPSVPLCPSFLTLSSTNPNFLSLGFNKTSNRFRRPSMPSAAAALSISGAAVTYHKDPRVHPVSGGPCRYAVGGAEARPARAWAVLRESRSNKLAWFHTTAAAATTAAEGFGGGGGGKEREGESEDKPERVQRRQRGGSSASDGGVNPDLLTIPGVGPRNLRKLVDNGIAEVAQLKQLYRDKFFRKSNDSSQKMVEFLRSSVGIIHKNHAESITTFIKESVDKDLKDDNSNSDSLLNSKKRLTFCVEGNISVGKSTFLQRIANETLELQDIVEIVPEPVGKWQDIGPDHFNILDAFYAEPERYAYTFQNYVFVTRVMQERESSGGTKPLRLMERSVFSDRMVFVRAVHEAKWMNEMEISIYDSWFDPVVSTLPGLIPDAFIYLRASPDTCHKRMLSRNRTEEGGVSLDYLRDLHEKHESWLFPYESGHHGVLSVSNLPDQMDRPSHPGIRDRVFYLEGNHMHPSIQKVPALVLDCEPNIDFTKDVEAKREYAKQVAEFFDFVKKKKDADTDDKASEDAKRKKTPQVLLPHNGGLWVPGGNHFPQSALKSLEFRRAMSYTSG